MTDLVKDQMIRLVHAGLTTFEIAAEFGCTAQHVRSTLSRARKAGLDVPYAPPSRYQKRAVHLTDTMKVALAPAAAARRTDVIALAAMIIDRVCTEELIDAVLDDGVTSYV